MLWLILLIVLIFLLIGAVPTWGYNSTWGWSPVSLIVVILVIVLVLYLGRGV